MKKLIFLSLIALLSTNAYGQDLKTAIEEGKIEQVRTILKENPETVNTVDEDGNSPLYFAASKGDPEIVKLLISTGADINITNSDSNTPLLIAVWRKNVETAQVLISNNADINIRNKYNATPLLFAANGGLSDITRLLISKGADVNVQTAFGTPLHRAALYGFRDVAEILLDSGADVNAIMPPQNWTPLHNTFGKHPEIVQLLIDNGADLNAKDYTGKTPLIFAINAGGSSDSDAAIVLIRNGAHINLADDNGETPLVFAVKKGFARVSDELIKMGADINIRERYSRRTLLHSAAINGYGEIAGLLLDNSIDENLTDADGRTAFYYANKHGNKTVADQLEKEGSVESNFGHSEYLSSRMENNEAYVWILKNRGWVIKTANNLFVFNNEELGKKPDIPLLANGYISASEIRDQNVTAYYTTFHARPDTYEFIHGIADSLDNITYLHYEDDPWKGDLNVRYLKGRQKIYVNSAEIFAFELHEEHGMGFLDYLICADGLKIYCSGFYPEKIDDYKNEIDHIFDLYGECDLAFLHSSGDPESEKDFLNYVVEKLKPKAVFPSHVGRHNYIAQEILTELFKESGDIRIVSPKNPGDRFHYKKGKIK